MIVELAPDAAVDRALAAISRVASLREITVEGRTLRARAERGAAALPLAIAALEEAALPVASATVARPSLDDVYLRHTGRSFAAGDAHASDTHINEKEKAA